MAREKEKMTYPNRLRALIEKNIYGGSLQKKMETFAIANQLGFDSLKRYVYGTAKIPGEVASAVAEKYNVTVDWLMCSPLNDYDVIEILKAFSTVLRVKAERKPIISSGRQTAYPVRTLYMDGKFFSFLIAVQELQYLKKTDISLDDETYCRRMNKIFSEFKDYFIMKFKTEHFDETKALEIEDLELLN